MCQYVIYLPSRGSQKNLPFDIMFFVTGLTYYLIMGT
jgi:hypothetical protein